MVKTPLRRFAASSLAGGTLREARQSRFLRSSWFGVGAPQAHF